MKANKRQARFGQAYRANHPKPIDLAPVARNLRRNMPAILAVMANLTANLRSVAENMRRAREIEQTERQVEAVINRPAERWIAGPLVANRAAPTLAELEAGTPIRSLNWFWNVPPEAGSTTGHMGGRIGSPAPATRTPEEFVQYADDVLEAVGLDPMYPEPHQHTDEPWPFRSF